MFGQIGAARGVPFRYPLSPILPQSWKGLPSPPTTAARHSQPERGRCFDCPFHSTMVMRAYFRFCQVFDRRTCSFLSKLPFKASETSEYSRFGNLVCFAVCDWCARTCPVRGAAGGGYIRSRSISKRAVLSLSSGGGAMSFSTAAYCRSRACLSGSGVMAATIACICVQSILLCPLWSDFDK